MNKTNDKRLRDRRALMTFKWETMRFPYQENEDKLR